MKVFYLACEWAGKFAAAFLWWKVVHLAGWEALWWAVPCTVAIMWGAYAQSDRDHAKRIYKINAELRHVVQLLRRERYGQD